MTKSDINLVAINRNGKAVNLCTVQYRRVRRAKEAAECQPRSGAFFDSARGSKEVDLKPEKLA